MVVGASAVLQALADRGYRIVEADESRLVYEPKGKPLPPDLYAELRARKSEILEYLKSRGANDEQQSLALSEPVPEPAQSVSQVDPIEVFGSTVALIEVRGFPVRLLADLPCPPCLVCDFEAGSSGSVVFDFRKLYSDKEHKRVYFNLAETLLLIDAIENRWPIDFRAYCRRKLSEPGWCLRFKVDPPKQELTSPLYTAQFLARIGLRLRVIEVRPI
jgi:hypothetical protein